MEVQASSKEFIEVNEEVNSLLPKDDYDFLSSYGDVAKRLEQLILHEDRSLQRPLAQCEIPLIIRKEVQQNLTTLGAVGGGKTPVDLVVQPTRSKCDLLYLFWELPNDCGKISNFEIEFEQIFEDIESALGFDGDGLRYIQKEPRYHKVDGNQLRAYVDFLCPGFKYKFRIRASNTAGWGWGAWCKSVVGVCKEFPIQIGYTKRIHRICIPFSAHYKITAMGGKAADGEFRKGGRGAIISATFSLMAGDILILLCGGQSSVNCSSGGGGGTFVARNDITLDNLLIVAGGGGGTRGVSTEDQDGDDASLTVDGTDGKGSEHGTGGINGVPGEDANSPNFPSPSWGYGGAGFMQDSTTASSFLGGGQGGQSGGFGGGGAIGSWGGGGGGGFSGGGGGRGGGGGGSFVNPCATNIEKSVGNEGPGSIIIEKADVPYPVHSLPHENCSGYSTMERPVFGSSSSQGSNGARQSQRSGESDIVDSPFIVNPSSHYSSPESTVTIGVIPSNYTNYWPKDESTSQLQQPVLEVASVLRSSQLENPIPYEQGRGIAPPSMVNPALSEKAVSQPVPASNVQRSTFHQSASEPSFATNQTYREDAPYQIDSNLHQLPTSVVSNSPLDIDHKVLASSNNMWQNPPHH